MHKAYIKGISYYLPEKVLTNEELVKDFPEWSVERVASKIGIAERRVAGKEESTSDLAAAAARELFKEYNIDPKSIDYILLCTQSPDYFLPTTACLVQKMLDIPTTAGALDFNMGCSGFVYGLSLAKGLICGEIARNVLLITSEIYTKHIHPKDKINRTIFGDAAAACLISGDGFAEIGNFSLGTDGTGAENLMVKTGGIKYPEKQNDLTTDESGNIKSSDHLFMNGTKIFNFTLEKVPILVEETLKSNGLIKSDISLYVFHQANKYMLNFLRKKIIIEEEKFYYCMEKVGNTVSSTIPIALAEAAKENKLNGNVLLAGFGVGYSWAGTILKFQNKP
ncbi:MAG: ketoacyl-ACP synthase III [Bacteroidetes bacterium]|nr:MAG: ketoacyl-ACP synthase III [Bacteroidota bacterium]